MSALPIVNDFAAKVRPLNAEQWQAWKLGERESDEFALDAPATLDEAVRQAMASGCWYPGDALAVLYTHTGRGKRTLWLYSIKRSTKRFTSRAALDGGRPVRVGALEPHLICETAVSTFTPVSRFNAMRDDPVGHDLTLVEG